MAERKISPAVVLLPAGLGLAVMLGLAFQSKAASGQIELSAGWNTVTYTGSTKKAGIAMQSIESYLEIAYYFDALAGIWKELLYDTVLETGMDVYIKVSVDCTWTF